GGMNRALAELDLSTAGACSHASPCYGNLDGNVNDARGTSTASRTTPSFPFAAIPAASDAYRVDAAVTGQDGYIDFKDEPSRPGHPLAKSEANGTYTVRLQPLGPKQTASFGSYFICYRMRSYGIFRREIAGYEALVAVLPPPPVFNWAAYA